MAQDLATARAELAVTPDKLYPSMLRFAARGEWVRLGAAVEALEPLIEVIDVHGDGTPGADLKAAVTGGNSNHATVAVLTFAKAVINASLVSALEMTDLAARRQAVRQVFADYLAIEPALKREAFQLTRDVSNTFRRLYSQSFDLATCTALTRQIVAGIDEAIRIVARGNA